MLSMLHDDAVQARNKANYVISKIEMVQKQIDKLRLSREPEE